MELLITKKEVLEYKRLEIISQIASVKSKIELFESKYGCKFEEFEKKDESQTRREF